MSAMHPKFVAISGPLRAAIFELTADSLTVGRDSANQVAINDISVSRRHCLIERAGGDYRLVDLDSHNGTFVNDRPVNEKILAHGDRLKIGNSQFLFLLKDVEPAPDLSEVHLEDETSLTSAAVKVPLEEVLLLLARDLAVLMRVSMRLNSIAGLEALQKELLEEIFKVVPAQRGAVLFVGERPHEIASVFGLSRGAGQVEAMRVSRTVVLQVLGERLAIMCNDVVESGKYEAAQSLIALRTRSLMCVPLALSNEVLGVIYVDTPEAATRFDKSHLQLVTAIANIAAGVLAHARRVEWLESENRRLRSDNDPEHSMVGERARMREVYNFISKVARTDSTVLIKGESGTGKELAARAIHKNSQRKDKPFVAVNCAALTESLLESELFGHERGAFTGAYAQKKGKLEVADGGTVFLDEVGEMSPVVQAKLLRVLQEREFERVGGTKPVKVNIRVLSASNRDLEDAVRRAAFRQDLFYRLNVVAVEMPPLRERREDIPLLANYFAAKYSKTCKRTVMGISSEARARLTAYHWPGNVRELENAVERAVVLGSTSTILAEDLPEGVLEAETPPGLSVMKYYDSLKQAKKQFIMNAMAQAGGDHAEAARILGIHPNNLHRLVRNLNLKPEVKTLRGATAKPAET